MEKIAGAGPSPKPWDKPLDEMGRRVSEKLDQFFAKMELGEIREEVKRIVSLEIEDVKKEIGHENIENREFSFSELVKFEKGLGGNGGSTTRLMAAFSDLELNEFERVAGTFGQERYRYLRLSAATRLGFRESGLFSYNRALGWKRDLYKSKNVGRNSLSLLDEYFKSLGLEPIWGYSKRTRGQ